MLLYFTRWLLHVSARHCHPQGPTGFLLSYVNINMVGGKSWNVWYKPMYWRMSVGCGTVAVHCNRATAN
jgi:hypothetical protein